MSRTWCLEACTTYITTTMNRLILASSSPRRKELLNTLGYPFEVIASKADEAIDEKKPLIEEIKRLSFVKALTVFKENKDAVVIGADTVVVCEDEVLGKPADQADAKRMLKKLSGKSHYVITAVTIISKSRSETFAKTATVDFCELSDEEIVRYIATGEPLDKAGAYGIQGYAARFIDKIAGDYYSIIGLPVSALYKKLPAYL